VATTTRGGLVGWIAKIPQFFSEVRAETRKVVWPSRKQTVTTGVMVLAMTTILAVFFLGVDSIFESIVKLLLSLAK
jgi:preprotein translocase subunit SecE